MMNRKTIQSEYPHRRRPGLAVFLSLMMPGMGHIYCGKITTGIVVMAMMAMFPLAWMEAMMIDKPTPAAYCAILWLIVLLAIVFAAIDSYRLARRTRFDYQLKDYNRWTTYLALIWIGGLGTIGYAVMVRENLFEAFRVPSLSMAPAIAYNDRVIANKRVYRHKQPQRGDVVLFKQPHNLHGNYVKRIVALGGDTVEIRDGELLINGQALEREWVEKRTITSPEGSLTGDVYWETNGEARYQVFITKQTCETFDLKPQPDSFGPVTVPKFHCFVMGDNRKYSYDSRQFGTLSLGALNGRFQSIYWPPKDWAEIDLK